MTQENLTKLNTYAVELEAESISLTKLNTYAVVTETPKIGLTKLNTYTVELTTSGEVYQATEADRPLYRDAPTGGIPYIDMSATGASLDVSVPDTGTYTLIFYNADATFTVSEVEFTSGANTIPITEDFNQLVGLRGGNLHRFTIDAVKEGMKARV